MLFSVSGIEQSSHERIKQFVSAVAGSRLGGYMAKLLERERIELGQRYLTDFVILSFKIQTEEEVKVRDLHQTIKHTVASKSLRAIVKMLLF